MDGMGLFPLGNPSMVTESEAAAASPNCSSPGQAVSAGKQRGKPRRQRPKCRVPGCTADLTVLKKYNIRYRICTQHHNADVVRTGVGLDQRFCQKCAQFHDLSAFDGKRHSCRDRLNRHNQRRRKTVTADDDGGVPSTSARDAGGGNNAAVAVAHPPSVQRNDRDDSLSALERILCSDDEVLMPGGDSPVVPSFSEYSQPSLIGSLQTQPSVNSSTAVSTSAWDTNTSHHQQRRHQAADQAAEVELRVPNLKNPSAPPLRVVFKPDARSALAPPVEPLIAQDETMNRGHTVTSGSPLDSPLRAQSWSTPFGQQAPAAAAAALRDFGPAGLLSGPGASVSALAGPSTATQSGEHRGITRFKLGAPGSGRIIQNPTLSRSEIERRNSDYCYHLMGEQPKLDNSPPQRTASY